MTDPRASIAIVAAYVAAMLALVYGDLNTALSYGHADLAAIFRLAVFTALHLALGFALARWFALAVYALPVALAVPAGRPPWLYHEPGPVIWRLLLAVAPVAIALIAAGIGARRLGPPPLRRGRHVTTG